MPGVLLYGPPASGKDTITLALRDLDTRYVLFQRLKAGPGRVESYRMTTHSMMQALDESGDIIWRNEQYGASYAIDRSCLLDHLQAHRPVVHIGQIPAVDAVKGATPQFAWVTVFLWCPRSVTEKRLITRGVVDVEERLRVWDATDIEGAADLRIDTSVMSPAVSAMKIASVVDKLDSTRGI